MKEKIKQARQKYILQTGEKAPNIAHIWKRNKVVFTHNEQDWKKFMANHKKQIRYYYYRVVAVYMIAFICFLMMFLLKDKPPIGEIIASEQGTSLICMLLLCHFGIYLAKENEIPPNIIVVKL